MSVQSIMIAIKYASTLMDHLTVGAEQDLNYFQTTEPVEVFYKSTSMCMYI